MAKKMIINCEEENLEELCAHNKSSVRAPNPLWILRHLNSNVPEVLDRQTHFSTTAVHFDDVVITSPTNSWEGG
jgi:hypothetical protein